MKYMAITIAVTAVGLVFLIEYGEIATIMTFIVIGVLGLILMLLFNSLPPVAASQAVSDPAPLQKQRTNPRRARLREGNGRRRPVVVEPDIIEPFIIEPEEVEPVILAPFTLPSDPEEDNLSWLSGIGEIEEVDPTETQYTLPTISPTRVNTQPSDILLEDEELILAAWDELKKRGQKQNVSRTCKIAYPQYDRPGGKALKNVKAVLSKHGLIVKRT